MVGTSVGIRLEQVKKRILAAEARAGRKAGSAQVLAVAKARSIAQIQSAFDAGQTDFAENYVQEAVEKVDQLENLAAAWHFIGRIQSNKVKQLVGKFAFIHSVDRLEIAEALDAVSLVRPQKIFIQVNVAAEASKAGVGENQVRDLVEKIVGFKNLRLQGLMVMPPLTPDPEATRPFFHRARRLLWELRSAFTAPQKALHPMDQLSMGTSQDFEVAVEEGATWVRVGTEIFGPRE